MRNRLVPKWYLDGTEDLGTLTFVQRSYHVMSTIALHSTLNISEMAYGLSNGHVTDNVT